MDPRVSGCSPCHDRPVHSLGMDEFELDAALEQVWHLAMPTVQCDLLSGSAESVCMLRTSRHAQPNSPSEVAAHFG